MSAKRATIAIASFSLLICVGVTNAQPPRGGQPPTRRHTAIEKGVLNLVEANQKTRYKNQVSIKAMNFSRVIQVNGIPEHQVGPFPNRGNPHAIKQIRATYRVTLEPKRNKKSTPLGMGNFGVGLNGVLFDPGAAEFWMGNRSSSWRYEALSGAVRLGLDTNHAHVQPDGKYHYHGIPTGLLESLKFEKSKHSPLVGWAADGHPIYAIYGYSDYKDANSEVKKMRSSYQLKKGFRPGQNRRDVLYPKGRYDGTFVNDYEYVEGSGDLDECNGKFTVTPEFPDGTYAYFLTESWPVIPRSFRGTPNPTFQKSQGQGRGQMGRQQGRGQQSRGGQQGDRRGPPPKGGGFGPPPRRGGGGG